MDAVNAVLGDGEMFGAAGACPVRYEEGGAGSRVLLVTGENAGGKSLVCRFIGQVMLRDAKAAGEALEFMRIGMEMRSKGGMACVFVFGDESWQSTGELTAHSVLGAIRNSRERGRAHAVCLDEPDTGLSESYQAAVGEALAAYAADLPELASGLIVVSHSRPLVSRLFALAPHCMRVGDDLRPTAEWLGNGSLPCSIEDLESLKQRSDARFRAVSDIQARRKAALSARAGAGNRR
jgi:predicted ATPase